jgi:hypothetical protein
MLDGTSHPAGKALQERLFRMVQEDLDREALDRLTSRDEQADTASSPANRTARGARRAEPSARQARVSRERSYEDSPPVGDAQRAEPLAQQAPAGSPPRSPAQQAPAGSPPRSWHYSPSAMDAASRQPGAAAAADTAAAAAAGLHEERL